MKKQLYLLILLCLPLSLSAQTYMRLYKITADGEHVGNLTARKTADGDTVSYRASADIIARVVAKLHIETHVDAVFVQNELHTASASLFIDGNLVQQTDLKRDGKEYLIDRNGHAYRSPELLSYSAVRLFFDMPTDKAKVYSELDGLTRTIRKTDDKKYKLQNPAEPLSNSEYVYSSEEGLFSITLEKPLLPKVKISQVRETSPLEPSDEQDASEEKHEE